MSEYDQLRLTVEKLSKQVTALEDRIEIAQLVARYGPAIDNGDAQATVSLWLDDGVYDAPPYATWAGHDEIAGMINAGHQELIQRGAGHVLTAPHIEVDGDRAYAWNHAMNIQWDAEVGRFFVFRLSANKWEFIRGPKGWRVENRTNRNLDGSREARALFADSAAASAARKG